MTYCSVLADPIKKKVEVEKKDLDQIAKEICPNVKDPWRKITRIIKTLLGEKYLIQHAETLKYHPEKANRKKADPSNPSNFKEESHENAILMNGTHFEFESLLNHVRFLIKHSSIEEIKKIISIIEQEKVTP